MCCCSSWRCWPGSALRSARRSCSCAGGGAALNSSSFSLRVMTWNIHSGVGPDGICDLTRVVEIIARHRPDVVALQEVDSRRTQAPAQSAFVILREAVGDHGIDAKSISTADGEYGQAVMSRWPLGRSQIHDITHRKRE